MTTDKRKELELLIEERLPLEEKLNEINKKISDLKSEIEFEDLEKEYLGFDEYLKKYYCFSLPRVSGDDWTDLTGYHGQNTPEMVRQLEKLFAGHYLCERHQEFDVAESVFEFGVFDEFFEGYDEEVVAKLNLYSDSGKLKNFEGLDEKFVLKIKNFIDMYTSIKVDFCKHDW